MVAPHSKRPAIERAVHQADRTAPRPENSLRADTLERVAMTLRNARMETEGEVMAYVDLALVNLRGSMLGFARPFLARAIGLRVDQLHAVGLAPCVHSDALHAPRTYDRVLDRLSLAAALLQSREALRDRAQRSEQDDCAFVFAHPTGLPDAFTLRRVGVVRARGPLLIEVELNVQNRQPMEWFAWDGRRWGEPRHTVPLPLLLHPPLPFPPVLCPTRPFPPSTPR